MTGSLTLDSTMTKATVARAPTTMSPLICQEPHS
ncbi:Uncharacterised protein [Mycobacteroides abscessus subsp. abscessus]|nr:Uncharacterised protein [Mycobacteroides abscessus subsp. abscessus]